MTAGTHVKRGQGRDRILDTALTLIGRSGLHALRLRDVADHAGMSLGSTTYHFGDRAELIVAALDRHVNATIDACNQVLDMEFPDPPGPTRARELLEGFAALYSDPRWVWIEHELYIEAARTGSPQLVILRSGSIWARVSLLIAAYVMTEPRGASPFDSEWIANRALAFADGIALRHATDDGLPQIITWHLESFFNYQPPSQMSDPFADVRPGINAAYWAHQPTAITLGESA